jgi:hypothetical protein
LPAIAAAAIIIAIAISQHYYGFRHYCHNIIIIS